MLDEDDIAVIRIFARAVDEERVSGDMEFHLLNRTLATAMSTLSSYHLDRAKATFNALDADLRRRIADRAEALAKEEVAARCANGTVCEPGEDAPNWKRRPIGIIRNGKFTLMRPYEPDFRMTEEDADED